MKLQLFESFMSHSLSSKDADSSDEGVPQDLEELRAVLAGLEAEMETLEASIDHSKNEPVTENLGKDATVADEWLSDLEDPTNVTRGAVHRAAPRGALEPLFMGIGEEEDSGVPLPVVGVVTDLNPKPGSARNLIKGAKRTEFKADKPKRGPKPPRESKRKSKREERKRTRSEKKVETGVKKQISAERRFGTDQDPIEGESQEESDDRRELSIDDLDMENPLPEAVYAPLKEHSDLVMDRRRRRQAAEVRAEMKEKEQHENWDQDDDAAIEEMLVQRRFNLPIYLVQALLVMLAGFLVVMGVRIAIKSTQDAKDGELLAEKRKAPGLEAVGVVEAKRSLVDFLSASNWQAKLEYVRRPEFAGPRMERYYAANPGEDQALAIKKVAGSEYNVLDGGDGFVFTCEMEDGSELKVPIVRMKAEAPYFVVDWETLVNYEDVGWAEFLQARRPGSRGIFRLYGCKDNYYNYLFDDEEKDLSLQLYDVDRTKVAYGYIKVGTPDWLEVRRVLTLWQKKNGNLPINSQKLMKDPSHWLPQVKDWAPMTLEVEFPDVVGKSYEPQLRVVRFVSPIWIIDERSAP
ncbi:MAG: hypothetical protein ACI8T1_001227 [Verrucomicrobiales bacterium]